MAVSYDDITLQRYSSLLTDNPNFVVRQCPTQGEGDCAFHALLGEWSGFNGFYCSNVRAYRKTLEESILHFRNSPLTTELGALILKMIPNYIMDAELMGDNSKALKEEYILFEIEFERIALKRWRRLEGLLQESQNIIAKLNKLVPLKANETIREQFYAALALDNDEWRNFIRNYPEIELAYNAYNERMEFNWAERVHDVIAEYAIYLSTDHRYLLPGELIMLAHIFHKNLIFYAAPGARPEIYQLGTGEPVVIVYNQNLAHFERALLGHRFHKSTPLVDLTNCQLYAIQDEALIDFINKTSMQSNSAVVLVGANVKRKVFFVTDKKIIFDKTPEEDIMRMLEIELSPQQQELLSRYNGLVEETPETRYSLFQIKEECTKAAKLLPMTWLRTFYTGATSVRILTQTYKLTDPSQLAFSIGMTFGVPMAKWTGIPALEKAAIGLTHTVALGMNPLGHIARCTLGYGGSIISNFTKDRFQIENREWRDFLDITAEETAYQAQDSLANNMRSIRIIRNFEDGFTGTVKSVSEWAGVSKQNTESSSAIKTEYQLINQRPVTADTMVMNAENMARAEGEEGNKFRIANFVAKQLAEMTWGTDPAKWDKSLFSQWEGQLVADQSGNSSKDFGRMHRTVSNIVNQKLTLPTTCSENKSFNSHDSQPDLTIKAHFDLSPIAFPTG